MYQPGDSSSPAETQLWERSWNACSSLPVPMSVEHCPVNWKSRVQLHALVLDLQEHNSAIVYWILQAGARCLCYLQKGTWPELGPSWPGGSPGSAMLLSITNLHCPFEGLCSVSSQETDSWRWYILWLLSLWGILAGMTSCLGEQIFTPVKELPHNKAVLPDAGLSHPSPALEYILIMLIFAEIIQHQLCW